MRQFENFSLRKGMAGTPPPLQHRSVALHSLVHPCTLCSKRHKHQMKTIILNTLQPLSKICTLVVIPTQTLMHFQLVLDFTRCVIHFV